MTPTKKQVATGVLAVTIPVATGGPAAVAMTQQSAAHRAEVSAARAAARTASRADMRPQARLRQQPPPCTAFIKFPLATHPNECDICFWGSLQYPPILSF